MRKPSARDYINEYIYRRFLVFMESRDAGAIADALTDKVIDDIVETADKENWNDCDIDIALSRIMLKTFVGEN